MSLDKIKQTLGMTKGTNNEFLSSYFATQDEEFDNNRIKRLEKKGGPKRKALTNAAKKTGPSGSGKSKHRSVINKMASSARLQGMNCIIKNHNYFFSLK